MHLRFEKFLLFNDVVDVGHLAFHFLASLFKLSPKLFIFFFQFTFLVFEEDSLVLDFVFLVFQFRVLFVKDDGITCKIRVLSFNFVEVFVEVVNFGFEVDDFLFVLLIFYFLLVLNLLRGDFLLQAVYFLFAVVEVGCEFVYFFFVLDDFFFGLEEFL